MAREGGGREKKYLGGSGVKKSLFFYHNTSNVLKEVLLFNVYPIFDFSHATFWFVSTHIGTLVFELLGWFPF